MEWWRRDPNVLFRAFPAKAENQGYALRSPNLMFWILHSRA